MDPLLQILQLNGPSRSSRVAQMLQSEHGLTPEAARKRLSRAKEPIRAFPKSFLPKREAFLYREEDRKTERFWTNFLDAMRETESVYGAAIDGLRARGGVIAIDEFDVISGAPRQQSKHVPTALVLKHLYDAGFVRKYYHAELGEVVEIGMSELGERDYAGYRGRRLVENVMLDGVREWAKNLGLASYSKIAIRGDAHPRMVGPYKWDLTGPSYLMPLREGKATAEGQGFLVADVFAGEVITHHQLRYMVRKATGLRATTKVGRVLPVCVAQGFTGEALTYGHKAGLLLATPASLFGNRAARALSDLLTTLNKAAEIVAGNPDKLASMIEDLSDIEGRAGNLRGVMFELMVAYLVRSDGSIDMGRKAQDPETGKFADIDILLVRGNSRCIAYECKGKGPGGTVSLGEVEDWLRRLPTFRAEIQGQKNLREAELSFELWTSGEFEPDALAKLEHEKLVRTKFGIDFKDGAQVRAYSKSMKETRVTKAFDEHFFRHPINTWS